MLQFSPMLQAAVRTMDYIEAQGPIGLTPANGLKRYFVHWAADAFAWPNHTVTDLFVHNKVLNEMDFPPLVVLHQLLIDLKIARHYKRALHLTKAGRALRQQPGQLFALLTPHFLFGIDHGYYTRFDDRSLGNWDIFLNVINVEAHDGLTMAKLLMTLYGIDASASSEQREVSSTIYSHVLRPLCWMGFLTEHKSGQGFLSERIYTKTPLWSATLRLDTDECPSVQ
ncbi:MAG: hypothetical protein ABI395_05875 [Sphingobium sp.]